MYKITCPCCGAEYLPSEIYIPQEVLGKSNFEINKTRMGNITDDNSIKDMDLNEVYECDFCGRTFRVRMKVKFETECDKFNEESKYTVTRNKLFMQE